MYGPYVRTYRYTIQVIVSISVAATKYPAPNILKLNIRCLLCVLLFQRLCIYYNTGLEIVKPFFGKKVKKNAAPTGAACCISPLSYS